ncbi:MAG TPA: hypothetical protein PKJ19_16155, partial [Flavobacteriales bacterium]|nr:hypothetical protein [Flavobacteriales bacterium]
MIGIGIFQKPDMLRWMLEGIAENFPVKDVPISVIFEAENSQGADVMALRDMASDLGLWMTLPVSTEEHILEHGCHRHLIEQFMRTDCDVLIIPQDDNRFQRPLLPDLKRLWEQYGTD